MKIRRITDRAAFDALAPVWDAVAAESGQTSPFHSHDWFVCCWNAALPDRPPEALVKQVLIALALTPVALGSACATAVVNTGTTPGTGGSTSSTTEATTTAGTGGAAGASGTGGGPPGSCVKAVDCVALNDACNVGTCINGQIHEFFLIDG